MLSSIKLFFSKGSERTVLAKKNITYSVFLKGLSVLIGLILLPVTINYINVTQYGVWLTLSSLVSWMSFFDIGLSNGLKNKLAEANAAKNFGNSKVLVSTTYALLLFIAVGLFVIFIGINPFIDWAVILNSQKYIINIQEIILIIFGLFCFQFVTQILNTILIACHLASRVSLIALIGQAITLLGVYMLIKFTHSSLLLLVVINGGVPVLVQLLAGIWYYNHELKDFAPNLKLVDFKYARGLLGLGGLFFIIQLGALVLFQTDNIVITQIFGPAEVTTFNIAYKLFSVFILGFNIIITPLWSSFTDAYAIQDLSWIESALARMKQLWLLISICVIIVFFLAPFIYKGWFHNSIHVPISLSFAMAFYVVVYIWQTIHVYILNGINKIRLQLYLVVISALLNIPIAIFLGHRIGVAGVTWSNSILFLIMSFVFSFQTKKILNKTAMGLLNR